MSSEVNPGQETVGHTPAYTADHTGSTLSDKNHYDFEFSGRAGEFFKIWIVNLVLTIVTLGIYSAWAKVRTKRYFYGNTSLAGSSFDYTANPVKILYGRLIAVALFVIYQLASLFFPGLALVIFLVLAALFPLVIVLSMRFRLHNSVWRGVRFAFTAPLAKAYILYGMFVLYLVATLAVPVMLMMGLEGETDFGAASSVSALAGFFIFLMVLLMPWWQHRYFLFLAEYSAFGKTAFSFSATVAGFFKMYAFAFLIILVPVVLIIAFFSSNPEQGLAASVLLPMLMSLAYITAMVYLITKKANLIYGNLSLGGLQVNSDLKLGKMIFLYVTNTLVILLTIGLAIPWAMIRSARYRAERTSVDADNLENFLAAAGAEKNATGEEVGEIFGVDIGL